MTSLIEHAERELRALPGKRDNARIMLERDVVALVGLFEAQRHSGGSAGFVVRALERLLRWKTLAGPEYGPTPLAWPESYQDIFNAIGAAVKVLPNDSLSISVGEFYKVLGYPERPSDPAP